MKSKTVNEAQFLSLLQKVLSHTLKDAHLATAIYENVAKEIRLINHLQSFEKFCEKEGLPNLEPETVQQFQEQLTEKFGETNVAITPDESGKGVAVEISLPDRTVSSKVRVAPPDENAGDPKVPFVPFPVSLPEDPGLVWVLARREDLAPEEAARALAKIEEEFWLSKAGQKLLRDRTERSFAEFVANVPAAALGDSGMKRHYKEPEPLQTLRLIQQHGQTPAAEPAERPERPERPKKAEPTEKIDAEEPVATDEAAEPAGVSSDDDATTPPWET